MTKRRVKEEEVVEVITPTDMEPVEQQVPPEIIGMVIENYNTILDTQMEQLHNRFVAYISESRLPVMQVIMVLHILLREATDMAVQKYVGDK